VPKIQFDNLPLEIARHLRRKMHKRQISEAQLRELTKWALSEPDAPDDDWWKDFGGFKLCGTGPHPKTVLDAEMTPYGKELE
jgi:hypothetical protein